MIPADITIGAHADHQDRHYRFPRQRADRLYVPIEVSPPVEGWGKTVLQWAGLVGFFVAAFIFAAWASQ